MAPGLPLSFIGPYVKRKVRACDFILVVLMVVVVVVLLPSCANPYPNRLSDNMPSESSQVSLDMTRGHAILCMPQWCVTFGLGEVEKEDGGFLYRDGS